MARIDPQINIRIPAELKARLERAAIESGRSLTAEIVQRVKDSFDLRDVLEKAEAQSSDDRVLAATALLSINAGGKVEGGVPRLARRFLRTERDRQAAQEIVDQLSAAIDKTRDAKSKPRVR